MNRGRLHAGKEGSGTLGGKAGPSLDAAPGTGASVTFCHRLGPVTFSGLSSSAITSSPPFLIPSHSRLNTGAQHHDNQIEACMWCLSIYSLTGGRRHVRPAWRLLGHGRSAETAAILLTGGFVEMAWTAWTAWCYLGPPCRRPPCRVLQQVQAQAQGMTTLLACIYHVPKYPPVSDVCDEAKDGTGI
jgi:hypothetical protein